MGNTTGHKAQVSQAPPSALYPVSWLTPEEYSEMNSIVADDPALHQREIRRTIVFASKQRCPAEIIFESVYLKRSHGQSRWWWSLIKAEWIYDPRPPEGSEL